MTNEVIRMTPIGKSKFVYVSEKDTQFDSNGIYHCSVEFSKEEAKPEIKAIHEEISKVIIEKFRKLKKDLPYRGGDTKRAPLPYKEENGKQSKAQRSKIKKDQENSGELLKDFGLGDGDIDDIFDLIAEEHPEI